MDDQAHIFKLLFQESAETQVNDFKKQNLIDDFLEPVEENSNPQVNFRIRRSLTLTLVR